MFTIAIDGAMATGKGTIAKNIANKLNFKVLDTGAIFRGIACSFVDAGYEDMNENIIDEFVKTLKVEVKFIDDVQHVFANGEDKTANLRTEKTSQMASKVSVYPKIREFMNEVARAFAKENNCVVEGRDIATVVLPNADVKFFFTAEPEVRARRRYEQLLASGKEADYEVVYKDMMERDARDSNREVAPLKPAEDSIILDNSKQTPEETLEECLKVIRKKMK